jgi:hypothetical protein
MKVKLQTSDVFTEPVSMSDLQTVIITDDFDQPIFVACKIAEKGIWTMSADDPTIFDTIKKLGINTREAKVVSLNEFSKKSTENK